MPYATAQHLRDEGWRPDQFGGAIADFDAYLGAVIADAALWVAAKLGAAYAGATGFVESCARRAEIYMAGAMLFKRRASFVDSGATQGLERQAYLERRGYMEDAARLHECALAALREALLYLGLPTDALNDAPALAVGHIETGPYPPTSAEALNVG